MIDVPDIESVFSFQGHLKGRFQSARDIDDFVPHEVFSTSIGRPERQPEAPLLEARLAARKIAESTSEPLWLCLSGGVDSECMAWAFLREQVPFRVAILRFKNELNWFDISHAVDFCQRQGLSFEFFDLDVDEFYEGGSHQKFATEFRCTSPQLTAHLSLLERIPGFPVLAWNATAVLYRADGKITFGFPSDLYFCYFRFLRRAQKPGVPFFFLYTPELIYSFLHDPRIQDLIFRPRAGISYNYQLKCDVYRSGGFPIAPRENKWTGFEEVKRHFSLKYGEDETAFDRHFRHPYEQMFPTSPDVAITLTRDFLFAPSTPKQESMVPSSNAINPD